MAKAETVLRFENVSFSYDLNKPIFKGAGFSCRKGFKYALMGQNGAGKSTLFKLINGIMPVTDGEIHKTKNMQVATALQMIPDEYMDLTLRDFFEKFDANEDYKIDVRIREVMKAVNMKGSHKQVIRTYSGGQKSRILLAAALIQKPEILLLDEPTNNLDSAGIEHLIDYLKKYKSTVIIISHDAEFLSNVTQGVLYLDSFAKNIEQYSGSYHDVVRSVNAKIEKQNKHNARIQREIEAKKDKVNQFQDKGGNMGAVAKKMKQAAEKLEEDMVNVTQLDRVIKPFKIPHQRDLKQDAVKLKTVECYGKKGPKPKDVKVTIAKDQHLHLVGPNGIGKTTLLNTIANRTNETTEYAENLRIGYYQQDFAGLNPDHTVLESLADAYGAVSNGKPPTEQMRGTAARFLLTKEMMDLKVASLSEGQKGLLSFARLVMQAPGLLIVDEPTNHINFRHLPHIAKALNDFEGAMILVSHVPEFVKQIRIDETLDLGALE